MKSNNTIKNKELIEHAKRIVRKAAAEKRRITLEELCREVRQSRPLHFYVSYDRAAMILHRFERYGTDTMLISDEIREMWIDLYEQVKLIMESRRNLTFAQALTQALFFCRPKRFYMAPDTVRRVISQHFCYVLTPKDDVEKKNLC